MSIEQQTAHLKKHNIRKLLIFREDLVPGMKSLTKAPLTALAEQLYRKERADAAYALWSTLHEQA